jgi:prophage regulatory protein
VAVHKDFKLPVRVVDRDRNHHALTSPSPVASWQSQLRIRVSGYLRHQRSWPSKRSSVHNRIRFEYFEFGQRAFVLLYTAFINWRPSVLHPSNSFMNEGFVRLREILAPNGPLPIGKTTWWAGVKDGRFPQPVKLGPRTTAWRVQDIRNLIKRLGEPK